MSGRGSASGADEQVGPGAEQDGGSGEAAKWLGEPAGAEERGHGANGVHEGSEQNRERGSHHDLHEESHEDAGVGEGRRHIEVPLDELQQEERRDLETSEHERDPSARRQDLAAERSDPQRDQRETGRRKG